MPNIWPKFSIFLECTYVCTKSRINATMRTRNVGQRLIHFSDSSSWEVRHGFNLCKYSSGGCGWGNNTSSENESKRMHYLVFTKVDHIRSLNLRVCSCLQECASHSRNLIKESKYLIYLRLSATISKRLAEVLSSFSLQRRKKNC